MGPYPRPEEMEQMPFAQLMMLRESAPPAVQGVLSPYEHRAFAREYVGENPLRALQMLGAVPGYQVYKGLFGGSRSAPAWEQLSQGYVGTWEGLVNSFLGAR